MSTEVGHCPTMTGDGLSGYHTALYSSKEIPRYLVTIGLMVIQCTHDVPLGWWISMSTGTTDQTVRGACDIPETCGFLGHNANLACSKCQKVFPGDITNQAR